MSTMIRPEISAKNKYYISKHRYYELKHFCLQYNDWKREYNLLEPATTMKWEEKVNEERHSDSTADTALRRLYLRNCISLVEKSASVCGSVFKDCIVEAVANDYSYEIMLARRNVPCCREAWYKLYRKFFYILDKTRMEVGA